MSATALTTAGFAGSGHFESLGGNIFCHRCGEEIDPRDRWDLDHVDGGGSLDYHGLSHSRCNRATYRRREEVPLDITTRIW